MFRTRSVRNVLLFAILFCMAVGSGWADDTTAHDGLSARWMKAWDAADAAGVAALYTEGAVLMTPNSKAATGRAAIEASIRQTKSEMPGQLSIVVTAVGTEGNLGYARGTYKIVDASGGTLDTGKWLEVRKRVDGKWLIDSDIVNSDTPTPN